MLIVGGGFGGLYAAKRLKIAKVDVVILDRSTSHLFQPLLYMCATGLLSEGHIASPIRRLVRRYTNAVVRLGEATSIDVDRKSVTATRFDGSTFDLNYDFLIVAAGMRTAFHGHDEFARYATGMKTLDDALAIRRKVIAAFEIAATLPTSKQRKPWLTFAVAGGGPTGVELAGQVRELTTRSFATEFKTMDPLESRVMLFHGADHVLDSFDDKLAARADEILDELGVEVYLGTHVTDVGPDSIEVTPKDDESPYTVETHTVLWTAGVEAPPFANALAEATGAEQDKSGRIVVEDDLTVRGHPNIWVIGDMMSKDELPGLAEVAMQGGVHAGHCISETIRRGRDCEHQPFEFRDFGEMAYLCRRHALVEVGPFKLSGTLGWLLWGLTHLVFLPGTRNRVGTLIVWVTTILFSNRRERAITHGDPETARIPYDDTQQTGT